MEKNGIGVNSIFLKSAGYAFPTDQEIELMVEHLKSLNLAFIGISVRTRYYKLVCRLTEIIKKNMSVPVVWGGIHPTIAPEKCIGHADIICIGEGEYAMKELAEKIERKEDYSGIKNLWVRKEGKIIKNEVRPLIEDLDSLPFTDFTDNHKV
ncbi:MAG: cobalamin-dependent protein, partial [Candidatus Aenigmatarchaeota archaeon]